MLPEPLDGDAPIDPGDDDLAVQRNGQVRLLPRNARHVPIDPSPWEDFAIEGIYCGLLRRP